jgi:acyl carrier protein
MSADHTTQPAEEGLRLGIARWLQQYLREVLGPAVERMDEHTAFDRYGLDSAAAIAMSSDLGEWLGCEVDAAAAYDYPSIADLSRALARDDAVQASVARRRLVLARIEDAQAGNAP